MPTASLGPAGRAQALGLAVAVTASALLVACGESEDERYGDAFTDVARPLTAELIDLGNAVGSASSRKPISAALGRADAALETAGADFEALDTPAEAAAAQDDLLAAIGDFEVSVERTRGALRDGGDREAVRAIKEFNSESQSFAVTLGEIGRRLEDAGIQLGDPASSGTP